MAYLPLPSEFTHDTSLIRATHDQLQTHLNLIRERYRRMYPRVEWHPIDLTPTVQTDAGEGVLAGSDDGTKYDPVYGEAVAAADASTFVQPHGSGVAAMAVNAPNRYAWKASVEIHAKVKFAPPDDALSSSGPNARRDITFVIATCMADDLDLYVNTGDKIMFRGVPYMVREAFIPQKAYWQRYTNIPLFVQCEASPLATGS